MTERLPDRERLIKTYVIKEALLSSSIEGIHTTLSDILIHALGETDPSKNTQLVLKYINALDAANMLLDEGFSIVSLVILKAHEVLMSDGEGYKTTHHHKRY